MTRFILLVLMIILPSVAFAESPLPRTHPTKDLERQKQQGQERSAALQKEIKSIETDLSKTKKSMVSLASKMKANEQKLIELENSISAQKQQQMDIEARLEQDKGTMSDIVLAMARIKRVPPEALLAKPGSPLKTAQSAMLLEGLLPSIYERASQLQNDREALDKLIADLEQKERGVIAASKSLSAQENELKQLLNKRERLLAKTSKDYKKQTAEVKIISAQAKTLKDLMKKIEKRKARADKAAQAKPQKASFTQKVPLPAPGKPQLPVSGFITTSYGHKDNIGAKSEGLTIQSRANSIVVAPMGGVVEYAGSFRNYGNMVLIKHKNRYVSLIAELGKINTAVGQTVSVGEPIGKTKLNSTQNSGDAGKTTIYYELRYKGNPINPSKKFSGIR